MLFLFYNIAFCYHYIIFLQSSFHEGVPMSVLATFGIVGGLSVLFLPETGGSRLLDTLKEEEHIAKINENEVIESKRMNNNCCT